ncbi:DUF4435 domain-containing protein [Salinarimonas ramus]|uniref:DUF4435 domain-containing protein n=1 Tax=Salinarimonas ramus TaxID=690164 RepID=A0A917V8M6_9HYPH|nr:DUF4435 domain-containing protein [Salinarimonas ramus]GGK49426.1 hypothetical protein GCM10011322_40570 [Salinarimonas ramus]
MTRQSDGSTDFEQMLMKEQSNPNAGFVQLLLSDYDEKSVCIFVEGKDDPAFYFDFFSAWFPESSILFFPCGGRRGVIGVKSALAAYSLSVQPKAIYYLRDRDFDDVLGRRCEAEVYRTDYYSVESYFANGTFFSYLLRRFSAPAPNLNYLRSIEKQINDTLVKVSKVMLGPMALLAILRSKGVDFNFDKLKIDQIIDLSTANFRMQKRSMKMMMALELGNVSYSLKELMGVSRVMRKMDFKQWVRGKILSQVMRRICAYHLEQVEAKTGRSYRFLADMFGRLALQYSFGYLKRLDTLERYVHSAIKS